MITKVEVGLKPIIRICVIQMYVVLILNKYFVLESQLSVFSIFA